MAPRGGGGHLHGCHCQECEHDPEGGEERTLFPYIDTDHIRCLNERVSGSGKTTIKPWHMRHDRTKWVESDADPELIMFIPFIASVKLKTLRIVGGTDGMAPSKLKVFANREDIDFRNLAEIPPTQVFELPEDTTGGIEHFFKVAKFQNINSVTLAFTENYGADSTRIYYVGMKGDFTNYKREAVTTMYEARPIPSDHQVRGDSFAPRESH